jgi:azobenzene reductase
MRIALLTGSVRPERQSHKVAYYLKKELEQRKIQTDLIDVRHNPLPVFGYESGSNGQPDYESTAREISERLGRADAIIFVTPEYHGSFSGVLKNTLDYFWSEFSKKPIGVAAASAGKMGGINASSQLQHVILSLGAYPAPLKLLVPEIDNALNDLYEPKNEGLKKSAHKFLDEFIWFADAVYRKKEQQSHRETA